MAILPQGTQDPTEGGLTCNRVRIKNKTGANSVAGLGLKANTGVAFSMAKYDRSAGDLISRFLAVSEEDGIADGSYHTIQLAENGRIITVLVTEAVNAGEYAVADSDAGDAGKFTGEAGITATHTLGVIMETIGAPGSVKVLVDKQ